MTHILPRRPLRWLAMSAASVALAGCTAADSGPRQFDPLSPKAMRQMDRLLAGKVAGEPRTCINGLNDREMIRISDDTVIYRVSSNLVYRNDLRYSCPGLARGNDVVVHRKLGTSSSCSGDIIQLVDRQSGIPGGSCVLGDFVPYRPAGADGGAR